jgi:hypothetical protein
LPGDKDLTIVGAGISATNLSCSSGFCFEIHLAAAHRIAGFTMIGPGPALSSTDNNNQNPKKHFRIDHNRIVSTSGWMPIEITGGSNGVHPQGLVDNNQFVDVPIHVNGTNFGLDEANYQHVLWSQQTPLGDSIAVVYIEANAFVGSSDNINWADSNYAGRYVFRFNTGTGRGYVEIHSIQGLNRASQRWEIYNNVFSSANGEWPGLAFIRGGSGVVFGNQLTGPFGLGLVIDNVRSETDVGEAVGQCNGSSQWDQNTSGQNGYACRDQIGRAYDTTEWSPGQPYSQALRPAYFWANLMNTSEFVIDNKGLNMWLQKDRDWYTTEASFNGTAGVGVGPVAARPSTCTAGVAYWATDEGEWNSLQAGPDGRLYRCTATNTWALHYTPYPYPHPWQGTGSQSPAAPNHVRILRAFLSTLPAIIGLCVASRRTRRDGTIDFLVGLTRSRNLQRGS